MAHRLLEDLLLSVRTSCAVKEHHGVGPPAQQPNIGGEVRPHQDSTFLHTDPPSVVGLWWALEDSTQQNGCLWALPGSHEGGVARRFLRTCARARSPPLQHLPATLAPAAAAPHAAACCASIIILAPCNPSAGPSFPLPEDMVTAVVASRRDCCSCPNLRQRRPPTCRPKQAVLCRRWGRRPDGRVTFDRDLPAYDLDRFVPLEVPGGALVLLHGALVHFSHENASPRSRHAYSMHVVEGGPGHAYARDNWCAWSC